MNRLPLLFALLSISACATEAAVHEPAPDDVAGHSDRGGIGITQQPISGPITVPPPPLDPRRSIVVTDKVILDRFPFSEVWKTLASQSGEPGLTAVRLFQQFWDTQNSPPGAGLGPHCTGTLNGFPYQCDRREGKQAFIDPFPGEPVADGTYHAVGLFNRLDLAPADGSNCGEYRISFARNGQQSGGRNFVIFEAALANPSPASGIAGCLPVAQFWADLSRDGSAASRAQKLHAFYFDGLPNFGPVISLKSFGLAASGAGQIRTNQFIDREWLFREYKLAQRCDVGGCKLRALPQTDKVNPPVDLFGVAQTQVAADFQSWFLTAIPGLIVPDVNRFDYAPPNRFNSGDSAARGIGFAQELTPSNPFTQQIQSKLTSLGSTLTPKQVGARAHLLSCNGCHQPVDTGIGGGLTWPGSGGFVHVAEFPEPGPNGPRFPLSDFLESAIVFRKKVLEDYLAAHTPCQTARNCCGDLVCIEDADACPIFCPVTQ
jgi:hypothetical protein